MTSRWFGEYEIVRQLRVGGMATLYLARRHGAAGFSRHVVLKLIHPHLVAQPSFLEMFVDEARICSQISHANVVHVEEFGVIDEVHYLVMEYIDGCSISELLRLLRHERRKLDPELCARVIMMIAGGLHAAHETCDQDGQPLDIVHRDISPSNILLSVDGNAKLIDFGIAKARNRLSETEAGVVLKGKYKYMAPEQATRSSLDRRVDIFSLGIVFWEMLAGRPLFTEESHAALFNRLERTEVTPPSEINPEVPVSLDLVVLAMLQHDPANRPQSAAEVQRRIAAAVPAAANRQPSELGALAIEVRDKREVWRANRRAAGEEDSHKSFSPTPRSRRATMSERIPQLEATAPPGMTDRAAQTWAPAPRRGWPVIPLGIIAGLAIVAAVIFVDRRGGREASASAGDQHTPVPAGAPVEAAGANGPTTPTTPTTPPPSSLATSLSETPAAAATAPAATAPAAAAPATIPSAATSAATQDTSSTVPPGTTSAAATAAADPSGAAGKQAPPAVRNSPPSSGGNNRAASRPAQQVKRNNPPDRPKEVPAVAQQAPPPPPAQAKTAKGSPLSDAPFDDPDNQRSTPADPGAPKTKKTPLAPDFDN